MPVRIELTVRGVDDNEEWECGLEFDYANPEAIYCRPLRTPDGKDRIPIPDPVTQLQLAFLHPMSGLTSNEVRLDPGAIQVRLGEGRTAEVLRNLCYQLASNKETTDAWTDVAEAIHSLFGVTLLPPDYLQDRGEIEMSYKEPSGATLDLSSAGRGLQQTLLLLAYMTVNQGSILLLDEPDAHLEILRQRQIYQILRLKPTAAGSRPLLRYQGSKI